MTGFSQCLRVRGTDDFPRELKAALLRLTPGVLPLEQGATRGGLVDESDLDATVLEVVDKGEVIEARVGVFFTEVIGNCACGDEPAPTPAYCVVLVRIDTATGSGSFSIVVE